jgi:hypothetical protein
MTHAAVGVGLLFALPKPFATTNHPRVVPRPIGMIQQCLSGFKVSLRERTGIASECLPVNHRRWIETIWLVRYHGTHR